MLKAIDTELLDFVTLYGKQIYFILFIIIFAKTAFVVLTFLPGDATLFASGAIAATGHLNLQLLFIIFFIATVAGDAQNYFIGNRFALLSKKTKKYPLGKIISDSSVEKTSTFLFHYGNLAIFFSRFVPSLSTTLPFLSGYTKYSFQRFFTYNVTGALLWTLTWVGTGYLVGNFTWVSDHLSISLVFITLLSFIPPSIAFTIEYLKKKRADSSVEA